MYSSYPISIHSISIHVSGWIYLIGHSGNPDGKISNQPNPNPFRNSCSSRFTPSPRTYIRWRAVIGCPRESISVDLHTTQGEWSLWLTDFFPLTVCLTDCFSWLRLLRSDGRRSNDCTGMTDWLNDDWLRLSVGTWDAQSIISHSCIGRRSTVRSDSQTVIM